MRSPRIALYTPKEATPPIAYNQLVQDMFYSCWRESYPTVRGTAANGETAMPPFTFGPLEDDVRANPRDKTVQLDGIVI